MLDCLSFDLGWKCHPVLVDATPNKGDQAIYHLFVRCWRTCIPHSPFLSSSSQSSRRWFSGCCCRTIEHHLNFKRFADDVNWILGGGQSRFVDSLWWYFSPRSVCLLWDLSPKSCAHNLRPLRTRLFVLAGRICRAMDGGLFGWWLLTGGSSSVAVLFGGVSLIVGRWI